MRIQSGIEDSSIRHEQFKRNTLLNIDPFEDIPNTIWIIGLGGIGGHVAEIAGSISRVKKIVLFDNDIVELSNLNRTIYTYDHLEVSKVSAAAQIISNRNINVEVIPINERFDEELKDTIIEDRNFYNSLIDSYSKTLIIDCRDDFYNDFNLFKAIFKSGRSDFNLVRAAYDGLSITIDLNPEKSPVWSNSGRGYQEAPSHSIPSRLAALLILSIVAIKRWGKDNTIDDCRIERLEGPYTFNIFQLFEFIHQGLFASVENNLKKVVG